MCEMNVTKQELNLIIGRLEDAISVCHTAPEKEDEGWALRDRICTVSNARCSGRLAAFDVI